ncbi:Cytochrome P450 [Quillaja saponaria]|uniref:Cytochrome P450 n=1 Tax=Quillaja saponaria TaxID=32244 RepID=A0AAD7PPB7_QUISA|nr:Cytochrome P450 [Quillaja saponaria]
MASLTQQFTRSTIYIPCVHPRRLKLLKSGKVLPQVTFPCIHIKHASIRCTNLTPWESSAPVKYAPADKDGDSFLKNAASIFETHNTDGTAEASTSNTEKLVETKGQPVAQLQLLKWPLWALGPSILLLTGMVPTLWLPISSIFLGPNIASLLSLVGLDCIFNIGATLFLLMADACGRQKYPMQASNSKAPFSYQFWNIFAALTGFSIPLLMMFGSQRGVFQPQLPFISFAVLLGPYLLLLSVQVLTEMLTWHWQSPVWLVTPIIYESYRVLQLMRGLKLGAELNAPAWMSHTIKGLVSWWVLILGMQLMRVAWFAGFTARARQQQSSTASDAASGV